MILHTRFYFILKGFVEISNDLNASNADPKKIKLKMSNDDPVFK